MYDLGDRETVLQPWFATYGLTRGEGAWGRPTTITQRSRRSRVRHADHINSRILQGRGILSKERAGYKKLSRGSTNDTRGLLRSRARRTGPINSLSLRDRGNLIQDISRTRTAVAVLVPSESIIHLDKRQTETRFYFQGTMCATASAQGNAYGGTFPWSSFYPARVTMTPFWRATHTRARRKFLYL